MAIVTPNRVPNSGLIDHARTGGKANDLVDIHQDYISPDSQAFNAYEMGGDPNFAHNKADAIRGGEGAATSNFQRDFGQADSYRNAATMAGNQLRDVYQGNGPSASPAMMQSGLMQAGVGGPSTNIRAGYANAQRNAMGANTAALGNSMNEMNSARGAYGNIGLGMAGADLSRQNNQITNDQSRNRIADYNYNVNQTLGDAYQDAELSAHSARSQDRQSALDAVYKDKLVETKMNADSRKKAGDTTLGVFQSVFGAGGKLSGM